MILIDTSVWADHFRRTNDIIHTLVDRGIVLAHPFVIGELAMGNLGRRAQTLADLASLPTCAVAQPAELLLFVDKAPLYGTGIGFVEAHLLASTQLTAGASLWTNDKRLRAMAEGMSLAARLM